MADVIQNTKGQIYANYGQICRLRHGAAPVSLSLHVLGLCLSLTSLEGGRLHASRARDGGPRALPKEEACESTEKVCETG